jgi:hypothetical protein
LARPHYDIPVRPACKIADDCRFQIDRPHSIVPQLFPNRRRDTHPDPQEYPFPAGITLAHLPLSAAIEHGGVFSP